MPSVDVVDETFLAVPRARVAAELGDPACWPRLWPDLRLEVVTDRGEQGVRWTVGGALVGSMEVWLEEVLDGTVLHYYLRADATDRQGRPAPQPRRRAAAESRRRQRAAKAIAFALKDRLESGRAPGEPPTVA
ncbi:polyketide cyclase / dehydrase and lipid transport [Pseudonocardia hispaniensis]|uniref:Polyketide cyclase / dehydrase and lipid transport n=1 Tax=Pseudonocardia hispaniensis TaxID=904933 RepID=A0ABW1IYH6_9PSEU